MWHSDGNSFSNGAIITTPRLLFLVFKNIRKAHILKDTSMTTARSVEKPDDSRFDFVDWLLFDHLSGVISLSSCPFGIRFSGNIFDSTDVAVHLHSQLLNLYDGLGSIGKGIAQRSR